ncbi:hypothetical protein MED222_06300 [Vibrio sp. MED222]|nr:hypothetical protein MED222_06300 [Vibrio sp. MED222]
MVAVGVFIWLCRDLFKTRWDTNTAVAIHYNPHV